MFMGKPNMNAKKGEFLKQCSGCFAPHPHKYNIGKQYAKSFGYFTML